MDRVGARAEARSAPRCGGAISSGPSRCPTTSASSSATAARSPTTAATIRRARRQRSRPRDYDGFRRAPGARRARQGRYIGIGIANAVEATGPRARTRARRCASRPAARSSCTPARRRRGSRTRPRSRRSRPIELGVDFDDVDGRHRRHGDDLARHRHVRGAHGGQRRLLGASRRARGRGQGEEARGGHDGVRRGRPRARWRLRALAQRIPTCARACARSR